MKHLMKLSAKATLLALFATACSDNAPKAPETEQFNLTSTSRILITSEAGDKIAEQANVAFKPGQASGTKVVINPEVVKQTMLGVGTSFTESSAFVLAHLEKEQRMQIMQDVYSDKGANFAMARTHIGATDFSVEGKYSYVEEAGDTKLETFTLARDVEGFDKEQYPNIVDESYDLLPMIKEAYAIKNAQADKELYTVASAWTAPAWMKDIETYFIPGAPENNYQGTGGELKPEYVSTYADYLLKYLEEYQKEGIDIWGLTPVNEPHGNSGQWESMHFTPETQRDFIAKHLGPKLQNSDFKDVALLIYDQNRNDLGHWVDTILGDEEASQYVYGTAVHWYASTENVFEDELVKAHNKFPDYAIINTEATIDDLGKPAGGGIGDPEKFQESGWFNNDAFWWNKNATDWAYTAQWAPNAEDHPIYTPVHRYARNIIVSFNNYMNGWIDWNIVLDHNGGPNHVGNFCGAPIMIDTNTKEVYYTPIFHVLSQFSQTIRPGDKAVQTETILAGLDSDALHASATVNDNNVLSVQLLNTTKEPINYQLQIGENVADVVIKANAVQTVQVQL
ncbi:glycoside hydrolase family 30 beta sandwich domain-containing protein [Thalassotalea aquiviva]|uniref:glycoside hydrolase family 30 protein n=1 Tax=Thalassotalea aquiviva TaxID=3242415 RepID=UPI00352B54B4